MSTKPEYIGESTASDLTWLFSLHGNKDPTMELMIDAMKDNHNTFDFTLAKVGNIQKMDRQKYYDNTTGYAQEDDLGEYVHDFIRRFATHVKIIDPETVQVGKKAPHQSLNKKINDFIEELKKKTKKKEIDTFIKAFNRHYDSDATKVVPNTDMQNFDVYQKYLAYVKLYTEVHQITDYNIANINVYLVLKDYYDINDNTFTNLTKAKEKLFEGKIDNVKSKYATLLHDKNKHYLNHPFLDSQKNTQNLYDFWFKKGLKWFNHMTLEAKQIIKKYTDLIMTDSAMETVIEWEKAEQVGPNNSGKYRVNFKREQDEYVTGTVTNAGTPGVFPKIFQTIPLVPHIDVKNLNSYINKYKTNVFTNDLKNSELGYFWVPEFDSEGNKKNTLRRTKYYWGTFRRLANSYDRNVKKGEKSGNAFAMDLNSINTSNLEVNEFRGGWTSQKFSNQPFGEKVNDPANISFPFSAEKLIISLFKKDQLEKDSTEYLDEADKEWLFGLDQSDDYYWKDGKLYTTIGNKEVTVESLLEKLNKNEYCYSSGIEMSSDDCQNFIYNCVLKGKQDLSGCLPILKRKDAFKNVAPYKLKSVHPRVAQYILYRFRFAKVKGTDREGNEIDLIEKCDTWQDRLESEFKNEDVCNAIKENEHLIKYLGFLVKYVNMNPSIINRNYKAKYTPSGEKFEEENRFKLKGSTRKSFHHSNVKDYLSDSKDTLDSIEYNLKNKQRKFDYRFVLDDKMSLKFPILSFGGRPVLQLGGNLKRPFASVSSKDGKLYASQAYKILFDNADRKLKSLRKRLHPSVTNSILKEIKRLKISEKKLLRSLNYVERLYRIMYHLNNNKKQVFTLKEFKDTLTKHSTLAGTYKRRSGRLVDIIRAFYDAISKITGSTDDNKNVNPYTNRFIPLSKNVKD